MALPVFPDGGFFIIFSPIIALMSHSYQGESSRYCPEKDASHDLLPDFCFCRPFFDRLKIGMAQNDLVSLTWRFQDISVRDPTAR